MDIITCPRCSKLFAKTDNPICDACMVEEEDLFERTKKYIDENPHCTIPEVCAIVGVTQKRIMKYLREGRLEIDASSSGIGELTCDKCGKPIKKGRYCNLCLTNLSNKISGVIRTDISTESKSTIKMFTADKRN